VKTKFISAILSVAVVLSLLLIPAVVPVGVASAVPLLNCGIEVQPAMTKVGFDADFSVNVTITNPDNDALDFVMCHIDFSNALVNVVSIDAGSAVGSPFTAKSAKAFDNTTGTLDVDYGTESGTNTTDANPILCTIHMKSLNASGIATLDFLAVDEWGDPETAVIGAATDRTNWDMVVNGAVKAGKATLTIATGNETVLDVTFPNQTSKRYQRIVAVDYGNMTATARAMFYPPAERTGFGFPVKVLYVDAVVDITTQDMLAQVVNILVDMGGGFEPATIVKSYAYTGAHGLPYSVGKNWSYNTTMYLPDLDIWSNGTFYANVTEWVFLPLSNYGVPMGNIPCFHVVHTDQPAGAGNVTYEAWFADPLYAPGLGFVKMVDPKTWRTPDMLPASETSLLSGISVENTGKVEITSPAMGQVAPPYPNYTQWAWDTPVTLKATGTAPGWVFDHWSGNLLGPTNPNTITMSDNEVVFPNFKQLPPVFSYLGPANLTFTCRAGGLNPDDQILEIMNSGGYKLAWSVADDASWLSENPTNGNLTAGVHQNINVSVNNSLLDPATYYANVTISGSPGIVVPVTLIVTPATSIDVWRDLPGNAMALNQTYPGMKFDVYVNFTAPVNDFNSIGLTDVAPAGWGVAVLNTSCNPVADVVRVSGNKVEIAWFGPYNSTQPFSAMYTVTVPETATPGINLFPNCNIAKAWCEYYFGESEPLASCVKGEYEIMITVPGKVTGETRDVNAGLLPDTKVVLERGVIAGASDESSPNYTITCWNTSDDYWLRATKDRYFTLDTDVIGAIAGHNINHTQYIDWSTADLLVHGYNLDMEGDYGLVPTACSMAYAMKSVNLWLFWPAANKEWGLSDWKALESVNSWQSPT